MADRRRLRVIFLASLPFLLVCFAAPIVARAEGTAWKVVPLSNTTAAPGGTTNLYVELGNQGSTPIDAAEHPVRFVTTFPSGLKATELEPMGEAAIGTPMQWNCAATIFPAAKITCTDSADVFAPHYATGGRVTLRIGVAVGSVAVGAIKNVTAEVSGGEQPSRSSVDPIRISAVPPSFGLSSVDGLTAADSAEAPSTIAASHPFSSGVTFQLNTVASPIKLSGDLSPVEALRDAYAALPVGLVGSPTATEACSFAQLTQAGGFSIESTPLCPPGSQIGTATVLTHGELIPYSSPALPVFRMESPPGVPARFGFDYLGTPVVLDAKVRSDSDYGISIISRGISEGLPIIGNSVTFWGTPASPAHESERGCPGERPVGSGGPTCPAGMEETPFLRNPTSCTGSEGLRTTLYIDSWEHPGALTADGEPDLSDPAWASGSFLAHEGPGYPHPPSEWGPVVQMGHCSEVPFEPSIELQPTVQRADSPTGLDVDVTMPQGCWEAGQAQAICQSDLKDSIVTTPSGLRLNPSAAAGLSGCSEEQIGFIGGGFPMPNPTHFNSAPPECPDSAKIGTVEVETPLLPDKLQGSIYQARQGENPFGSTVALYVVASADGVMIKLPVEVNSDPQTGQLTTAFRDNPQLPFEHFKLHFFGGQRAPLITPPTCGTFTTHSDFTGWANPEAAVHPEGSFQVTEGCGGGFAPKLSAGTENPLAGSFSPFNLRLSREDGSQELGGLTVTLPQGLLGKLAGIPYCPDSVLASISAALGTGRAQEANPSCPAASQLGTVTVGAGAGTTPFYTQSGRAYLAGPYKGAPLSIAVVAPAVAGPFDLGTVVVRNALQVNPETAQVSVASDPFPTILHGIPLDLRDVRVDLNRPSFTLNPTSCEAMQIASTITSAQGASASPSVRFQVGGCERLAFKPKLSLKLKGKTSRSASPALSATLTMPPGNANIASAQVALPHSEFLDQAHIRTICTRVQYAAGGGGGERCPKGSVYGHAIAYSPLLEAPLQGPVYLRSSSNPLPDLVASLSGQIHIDLDGRIDSHNGGIRTTFQTVPDAPVSKFVLRMPGGKKGLLENSTNVCRGAHRATVAFDAQNGKLADFSPALRVAGCGKAGKRTHHKKSR